MSGPSSTASTDEQRRLAGRYLLRRPVGRGGAGVVWQASDELLGRTVAIKECMLPPTVDDTDREKLLTRVMREARTAARLDHPALVTVFDVVQENDRPWIVMEYVESRSLSQVIRQDGPLPAAQVAEIGLTLLDALHVAHSAGVLHRDVKPANVLMTESGNVVLTDFGIAATTGDPTLTTSGMLLGSPSYMPPERARGEAATPASDLWSLAATLYTLVEGTTPYSGDHPLAVLSAVAEHRRRPMEFAGPLEPLLGDILDTEPEHRPSEMSVRRRLERIRAELAAGPTTTGGTPVRPAGTYGGEKSAAERTARLHAQRPGVDSAEQPAARAGSDGAGADGAGSGSEGAGSEGAGAGGVAGLAAGAAADAASASQPDAAPGVPADSAAPAPDAPSAVDSQSAQASRPRRTGFWARRHRRRDGAAGAGAGAEAGAVGQEDGPWEFENLFVIPPVEQEAVEQETPAAAPQQESAEQAPVERKPAEQRPVEQQDGSGVGPAAVAVVGPGIVESTTKPPAPAPPTTEPTASAAPTTDSAASAAPATVPAAPAATAAEPEASAATDAEPEASPAPVASAPEGRGPAPASRRTDAAAPSVVPPAQPDPRKPSGARRRTPVLLGALALVAVAAIALVLVLAGGKDEPRALPGVPAPSASAGAGSSPGTSGGTSGGSSGGSSTSPSNGTGAAAPDGWQTYRDPRFGWSIALPPEFRRTGGGTTNQTDFRDGTGRLLRVEIAPKANPSAIGDWRRYEPTFARQVSNFERVRLEPADGADGVRAADWEFTFDGGNSTQHVLNRGVIDGRTAHALYWQTPESAWESSQALRDQIFATFTPPPQ